MTSCGSRVAPYFQLPKFGPTIPVSFVKLVRNHGMTLELFRSDLVQIQPP
jgi:hypothetical protein